MYGLLLDGMAKGRDATVARTPTPQAMIPAGLKKIKSKRMRFPSGACLGADGGVGAGTVIEVAGGLSLNAGVMKLTKEQIKTSQRTARFFMLATFR